jgi:hypothetical protein
MHKILKATLLLVGLVSVAQSANVIKKTVPIKLFSQMKAQPEEVAIRPVENLAEAAAGCDKCGGCCDFCEENIVWDCQPAAEVTIEAHVCGCDGKAHKCYKFDVDPDPCHPHVCTPTYCGDTGCCKSNGYREIDGEGDYDLISAVLEDVASDEPRGASGAGNADGRGTGNGRARGNRRN